MTSQMSWLLTGNSGTNPPTDFLGTSGNQALVVATNGIQRALIDTSGNIQLACNLGIGTGTNPPRSLVELEASSPGSFGPILTLTNNAADQAGSSVNLDLNTFPPPRGGFTTGTITNPPRPINYNPGARIAATSAGNYEADIGILSNNPGSANNGLSLRMQITPKGTTVYGTMISLAQPTLEDIFGTAGVPYTKASAGIGIGTSTPRSALEASVNAPGALGPIITLTNTGGGAKAAAAIDLNSYSPTGTYYPTARIEAVDDGNYSNDIVFQSKKPGAANNGLVETMRASVNGVGIGETSPAGALHITGPANAPPSGLNTSDNGLLLGTNGTSSYKWIQSYGGPLVLNPMGNDVSIGPAAAPWLTISSAGLINVANDIVLTGADCAEHFDVVGPMVPEPGTVLVIDQQGCLRESCDAYDKKVAGVVSGAGEYRHGILLDGRPSDVPRVALALTGKAYCKVDAQYGPVEVGDLLTTSPTPGHAMKATEPAKAFGSVIGKALRGLEGGQELIPILISLQ